MRDHCAGVFAHAALLVILRSSVSGAHFSGMKEGCSGEKVLERER